MNPQISKFLEKEHLCVFSVLLPDGSPHSATVHFVHEHSSLKIFIQTSRETKKAVPFLNGEIGNASMVVGCSEAAWTTMQMRGTTRIVSDIEELNHIQDIYYKKHPSAKQYHSAKTVTFEFVPTWWRYTDMETEPELIIEG